MTDALSEEDDTWGDEPGEDPVDTDTLRSYLRGQDSERLVELLLAEAAAAAGKGVDVGMWRGRLEVAFGADDFVEYAEAGSWAHGVLQAIEVLLYEGHAGEAWDVATARGCDQRQWMTRRTRSRSTSARSRRSWRP